MKMISYWKNSKPFHEDDGMVLIYGYYDHKHEYNGGTKELGKLRLSGPQLPI